MSSKILGGLQSTLNPSIQGVLGSTHDFPPLVLLSILVPLDDLRERENRCAIVETVNRQLCVQN